MSALELKELTKSSGKDDIIRKLDLKVEPGTLMVLTGNDHAAASLLLKLIAGLEDNDGGKIYVNGRDVTLADPQHRDVRMVFSTPSLLPQLNVAQNIAVGLRLKHRRADEIKILVADAAQTLGITELLELKASRLTVAQSQRVALCRALVSQPKLYLLDDPALALSGEERSAFRLDLKLLQERLGLTVIMTTSDPQDALTLGTQLAVLDRGVLQQTGIPEEIYRRPQSVTAWRCLSTLAVNLLEGVIGKEQDALFFASGPLRITLGTYEFIRPVEAGQRVLLGLRAENFSLSPTEGGCRITLPVSVSESNGADALIVCACGNQSLCARVGARSRLRGGDKVTLYCDPGRASLFDAHSGLRV